MKKNVLIVHYNTPYLTECLVKSINLFVKDAVIYIFDNSDKNPFIAKFDNVTVFDNTKGEIIDFKKWLEKYPKRNKSHGSVNNFGSAKHCYSVEKCMELINDNFVLLDSDVLLKRDISNLFLEDKIFCGEITNQPSSTIKRILPFICYINVKLCKEKNIHYFDENFMHGLWKTASGDRYDTGASFFLSSKGLPYADIKCSNYVVHYGHGSWNKENEKPIMSPNDWLELHSRYWSEKKNNKVIYTCITSGYDTLMNPKYYTKGFDYVCFTDNKSISSDIWDIRPLPKECEDLSQVKKQRYVKINPHKLLSDYDISIWVDGNVVIKGDLNEFINKELKDDCSIYAPTHPSRNCIYSEELVVIKMGKDKVENTRPQIERYKEEGFPKKYGLIQSNILLRRHNDEDCIRLMECWFEEVKNGSHRDQLSFNYAAWKNDDINIVYLDKEICKSKYFFWNGAHIKQTQYNSRVHKNVANNIRVKTYFDKNVQPRKVETFNVAIYD